MLFNVMHASAKRKVAILQQAPPIYMKRLGLIRIRYLNPGRLNICV